MSHPRAKIFFLLYLFAIIYLSFYPGEFALHPKMNGLPWVPIAGRREILDVSLNILFYVPLGVAGCLSFRRRGLGFATAILIGTCLSWAVEWLQLWSPRRFGNLTDLASNAAGTVLGASLALLAVWRNWPRRDRYQLGPTPWLLFSAWILSQGFPFVPALEMARITGFFDLLAPWSWRVLIEVFLVFAALRFSLGTSGWIWAAYAALFAQAFLLDRSLSPAAACGASLAWIVAKRTGSSGVRWLGLGLPVWLLLEELRPFTLTGQFRPLTWAPFASWYAGGSIGYYAIIFGKLSLYLSVVWGLRERGSAWVWAVGIPGAILLGGELAQQYIVDRTPESTDLALLAAGAALLALCSKGQPVPLATPAEPNPASGAIPRPD